jgi:hypothetical protein
VNTVARPWLLPSSLLYLLLLLLLLLVLVRAECLQNLALLVRNVAAEHADKAPACMQAQKSSVRNISVQACKACYNTSHACIAIGHPSDNSRDQQQQLGNAPWRPPAANL